MAYHAENLHIIVRENSNRYQVDFGGLPYNDKFRPGIEVNDVDNVIADMGFQNSSVNSEGLDCLLNLLLRTVYSSDPVKLEIKFEISNT